MVRPKVVSTTPKGIFCSLPFLTKYAPPSGKFSPIVFELKKMGVNQLNFFVISSIIFWAH